MTHTIIMHDYLGFTKYSELRHSPAIQLEEDGRLWHWNEAEFMKWEESKIRNDIFFSSRYSRWKKGHGVYDLKQVKKIKYLLKVTPVGFARSYAAIEGGLTFYRSTHRDTVPYFQVSSLWLAVKDFKDYLNKWLTFPLRNDFDPRHNWRLRDRPWYTDIEDEDQDFRELPLRSFVISSEPLGEISWDEIGQGVLSIQPSHRSNQTVDFLLPADGQHPVRLED